MENILLALDGTRLDTGTVDFACFIAQLTHSKLTGVFIENRIGEEKPVLKQLYGFAYVETITADDFPENTERLKCVEINEQRFGEACETRGVHYHVRRHRNALVRDMVAESRYADLMIINAATSFEKQYDGIPSQFVKDVLRNAECPVIIAPYSFYGVDEILFTYDGSRSSVYAIKQFTHLFPELSQKKVTVVHVDEHEANPMEDGNKLKEWLHAHFCDVEFKSLQGRANEKVFEYLLGRKNVFVVMGAYGRGQFSNLFRHSVADLVVKSINLPVFVAHY